MRQLLVSILVLFLVSCRNTSSKKESERDTTETSSVDKAPVTPAKGDTIYTGVGTEPFWAVYVLANDRIIFHPAEGAEIEVPYVMPTAVDSITEKYSSGNDSIILQLTVTKRNCNNGMSEVVYGYETGLLINAVNYKGCGSKNQ